MNRILIFTIITVPVILLVFFIIYKKRNQKIDIYLISPENVKDVEINLISLPKDKNRRKELKVKPKGIDITPYSPTKENILVVGPISGDKYEEITFPLLSPDPAKDKNVFFAKYPIYVGANRGRGQVYPTGEKTNNNLFTSTLSGKIQEIKVNGKDLEITVLASNGETKTQSIPKDVDLIVKENQVIKIDQALTTNPNVGGFGQTETEIVLQDPARIYGFLAFCVSVIITQSMFVFKKKQFEKVQLAELDF
jgi:apocytochrome f